eukprot:maker-scaffold144_size312663-snap-gene-2.33 protein:Tk07274 transcript:maker-scaffold144_size312663-snap-gene-2.33-mRNA-1 annotation:"udp-glucuronosyltransferase 2b31-like isoform 1"
MSVLKALPIVFLVVCVLDQGWGDKFLIFHPFYSGSHVLTLHTVSEALIKRGHEVTTLRFADSHGLQLRPLGPKHKEIYIHLNNSDGSLPYVSQAEHGVFEMPMQLIWDDGLALFNVLKIREKPWKMVAGFCHQLFQNQALITELREAQFDLVLMDLVYNECGLSLIAHLKLPYVGYWAFSFVNGEAEMTTVATPPSHVPMFMSTYTHRMAFLERVVNFGYKVFGRVFMWGHIHFCDLIAWQYFPDIPSTRDTLGDMSGALLNTDNILDYPRLQPETFLNIGGMQISETPKPLPQDIQAWIDGAEHGIVLFTMGFIFNPAIVPQHRIDALLGAFARLPQRVIVKFDSPIPNAPENVLILPFVPQQDILAHPKTRVFFTHCGMHGVMEAIYHRVPMVGMPIFIDQGDMLTRMVEKGIAQGLRKMADQQEIYEAIVQVRDDPRYKANVDSLSDLMRLRRHHPMEDAVWLMEYLSKTQGAEHLKLSSRHLNLIQYFSFDVVLFWLLLIWIGWKLTAFICSRILWRRPKAPSMWVKSKSQ